MQYSAFSFGLELKKGVVTTANVVDDEDFEDDDDDYDDDDNVDDVDVIVTIQFYIDIYVCMYYLLHKTTTRNVSFLWCRWKKERENLSTLVRRTCVNFTTETTKNTRILMKL